MADDDNSPDLTDAYQEVTGSAPASSTPDYQFPDDTTHPLSSYSQRPQRAVDQAPATDLDYEMQKLGLAQQRLQAVNQLRDVRANRLQVDEQGRTLQDSSAAMDLLGNADPYSPDFEKTAQQIQVQHPRAFADPAFERAFAYSNGIFQREVKSKQQEDHMDARAAMQQQQIDQKSQLAAQNNQFEGESKAVRGLGPQYDSALQQKLADLGDQASHQDRMKAVTDVRVQAGSDKALSDLTANGENVADYTDPNTGQVDFNKYATWQAKEAKEHPEKGEIASANATVREFNRRKAAGENTDDLDPVMPKIWQRLAEHAVGGSKNAETDPTGHLFDLVKQQSQLNAQRDAGDKTPATAAAIAQGDAAIKKAAAQHPPLQIPTDPASLPPAEFKAQRDKVRSTLATWPLGTTVNLNGKVINWDQATRDKYFGGGTATGGSPSSAPAETPDLDSSKKGVEDAVASGDTNAIIAAAKQAQIAQSAQDKENAETKDMADKQAKLSKTVEENKPVIDETEGDIATAAQQLSEMAKSGQAGGPLFEALTSRLAALKGHLDALKSGKTQGPLASNDLGLL